MLPPFMLPSRRSTSRWTCACWPFALALSVVTGVLFGLAPALQATKPDLAGAMKEGGRGRPATAARRRLRSALVVVEVALAFILLAGGGLLVRSFFQMMNVELGFDATNVLTLRLPIASDRFATADAADGATCGSSSTRVDARARRARRRGDRRAAAARASTTACRS